MRKVRIVLLLVVLLWLPFSPLYGGQEETATVTLKVEGMTCVFCVPAVKKALKMVPGVKKADVSYKEKRAVVEYEEDKTSPEDMIKAVKKIGFKTYLSEGK